MIKFQYIFQCVLALLCFGVQAQKSVLPTVKVQNETNAKPMQLQELSVDILVMGQTALTTLDMTFYNPNSRVMEGEFEFPLSDGQEVSRFALDINGKLREGVVVDKAEGRKAFEEIVRRGVDPGLLEKTEGNNFRARVYPMPAQGSRRIVIAFEQELGSKDGEDYYFLPIAEGVHLKKFSLRTEVISRLVKADIKNSLSLDFKQSRSSLISEVSKTDFKLDKNIALRFPKVEKPQLLTATEGGTTYFYGNISPTSQKVAIRPVPKRIGILWDNSSSAQRRDLKKEFALLEAYFKELKNVSVELTTFNIRTSTPKIFEVKDGNWAALKAHLEALTYDGATDGNAMQFNPKNDQTLLFTDAIFNFGSKEFNLSEVVKSLKSPVDVVNSSVIAATDKMRYLSASTGGSFVNLATEETSEAVKALLSQPYHFLGYTVKSGKVANVYPEKGAPVAAHFTFAGELLTDEATLVLSFGYNHKTLETTEVTLKKAALEAESPQLRALLRRVWAEKKIAQLRLEGTDSKKIDEVGRAYGIVTEGNSLIVLETVEDYLRYKIVPPEELQKEYYHRLDTEKKNKEDREKEVIKRIIGLSNEQSSWWNTTFPKEGSKPQKKENEEERVVEVAMMRSSEAHRDSSHSNIAVRGSRSITPEREEAAELSEVVVTGNAPKRVQAMMGSVTTAKKSNSSKKVKSRSNRTPAPAVVEDIQVVDNANVADDEVSDFNYYRGNVYKEETSNKAGKVVVRTASGEIQLNAYNPDTPYLKVMEYAEADKALDTYHRLKKEYGNTPSFYVDVADYFFKKGNREQAILVISNLAELGLEDAQLLRVLGYKLSAYTAKAEAVNTFRKVLKIREEEPQSYRDLGLALADEGQYDEAVKTLYHVVTHNWDSRFHAVQLIVMNEINDLIMRHKGINTSFIDKALLKKEPVDVRVVLTWDTDNSDMDLWVFDPEGEKCYYGHRNTYLGGKLSNDITRGYGPEEFMLKKAPKGKYKVSVNYYGNHSQKQLLPVSLRVTFFTGYGTPQEKKQEVTLRLSNNKDVYEVGMFEF